MGWIRGNKMHKTRATAMKDGGGLLFKRIATGKLISFVPKQIESTTVSK